MTSNQFLQVLANHFSNLEIPSNTVCLANLNVLITLGRPRYQSVTGGCLRNTHGVEYLPVMEKSTDFETDKCNAFMVHFSLLRKIGELLHRAIRKTNKPSRRIVEIFVQ